MLSRVTGFGATLDVVRDKGLRHFSLASAGPNADILNAILAEKYFTRRLLIQGGLYYIDETIDPPTGRGGPLISGNCGSAASELSETSWNTLNANPAAAAISSITQLVWVGPTEQADKTGGMIRLTGTGAVVENLNLVGRRITGNYTYSGNKADYAIRFEDLIVAGANPSSAVLRNLQIDQCKIGIHVKQSDRCDTLQFEGIIECHGTPTLIKIDEFQAMGINIPAQINFKSEYRHWTVIDLSGDNGYQSVGTLLSSIIQMNSSATALKTGRQGTWVGPILMPLCKWDHTDYPNARGPIAIEMKSPSRPIVRMGVAFGTDVYRRPLIYPLGNEYDVRLADYSNGLLHAVDKAAWPEHGISHGDTCMAYVPDPLPNSWWRFSDPGNDWDYSALPADNSAIDSVANAGSDAGALTQSDGTYKMNFLLDGMHHRPCMEKDGTYYSLDPTTNLGPGQSELYGEWVGYTNNATGVSRTICSVSGGTNQFAWNLGTDGDGYVYFSVSGTGSIGVISTVKSLIPIKKYQQTLVTWRFVGGTGGTGRMYVTVNGVTAVVAHSIATIYNATADFYFGATNSSGTPATLFSGRTYDLKIYATYPGDTDAALNRDAICSQVATPVDVYCAGQTITAATNATPIVITSTLHGVQEVDADGNDFQPARWAMISGVTGNTNANGLRKVTKVTENTLSLKDISGADVAGSGAYVSGGTITLL